MLWINAILCIGVLILTILYQNNTEKKYKKLKNEIQEIKDKLPKEETKIDEK